MAIRSDITRDMEWAYGEAKTLQIAVVDAAGDPINLQLLDLSWRVLREQGSSTVYLEKTSGILVTGDDDNIAEIEIDPETDYEDLFAGIHYHELWSVTDHLVLSKGDAWLLSATLPPA